MQTTDGDNQQAPDRDEHLDAGQRIYLATGAGLFVALIVLAYVWPSSAAGGVTICPFRRAFGLSCFGCGMTRGWTALLHGNWLAALTYHPFSPVLLVGSGVWALRSAVESAIGCRLDPARLPGWKRVEKPVLLGALVFVVIFGLLRLSLEIMGVIAPV